MLEERPLSEHVLAAVRALLSEAAKLHNDALRLETHVRTLITHDTQVNLDREHWTLDLAGGKLVRNETADGSNPPPDD